MNKKINTLILTLIFTLNLSTTFANEYIWNNVVIINQLTQKNVNAWDIFNFFASFYDWQVPESYKYIKVNYKDIKGWSQLEDSIKKLIYLDLIKNPNIAFQEKKELNAWNFYRLSEKILKIQITDSETKEELQNRFTTLNDISTIRNLVWTKTIKVNTKSSSEEISQKKEILNDVYDTIINWHYDKEKLDEWKILDSAISWIAAWTNDKHTVYFPPIESKSFQDSLSGEYEWIWAYVDMEKPWAVRILSPIAWSPSEKAGLKWWDLIIKVNGKEITKENSLNEVISWIKWPAWSVVTLTIIRWDTTQDIKVTRDKIIIKDIESKVINSDTYYIQIKSFWENVSSEFKKSLQDLKEQKNIKKIIIDVRNNGGWYLEEVTEMLSYLVKKWEKTAVVKYHNSTKTFTSRWYDLIDFSKYKLVILQNSWTASASEILIWTIKDYYPDVTLIWENSYWKWSVQVIKNYIDWSMLKYTIAKWFTWRTETWIDWVWIQPTIKLELDLEKFNKDWFDNQLDKALNIK